MEFQRFRYMAWAKEHATAGEFPLHQSGMPAATLASLGLPAEAVCLSRPIGPEPDEGLVAAIAARYRVPPECVMPTCGTHHANLLVARALVEPGSVALVEVPYYEDVPGVLRLAGAEVRPFGRRMEDRRRLPMAEIREGLRAGARIVAVTDLHNPTGAHLTPEDLAALEGAAREFGATVLVDEVYRDFLPGPAGTAFHEGGPFVVTSSLTKVYGLGGIRVGWAIAPPALRDRLRDLNEYLVVNMPAPSASAALAAWPGLDAAAERARGIAATGQRVLAAWIRGRKDARWSPPDGGIAGFVALDALEGRDDVAWCERLLEETGVGVVPGSMFGEPGAVRMSFSLPPERLSEALARVGAYLDAR